MHTINDNQGHFKSLLLFPDYSSSAIWCSCGLGCSDPEDTLLLPKSLMMLINLWNNYWEICNDTEEDMVVENIEELIINSGKTLAKMVSYYYPCEVIEERCLLYRKHV